MTYLETKEKNIKNIDTSLLEIPEDLEIGGPPVVKQELRDDTSSDSGSRTSVFSDYLPCGLTRFHFSLCFGMVGFVVFWLGLLLRIYLPH